MNSDNSEMAYGDRILAGVVWPLMVLLPQFFVIFFMVEETCSSCILCAHGPVEDVLLPTIAWLGTAIGACILGLAVFRSYNPGTRLRAFTLGFASISVLAILIGLCVDHYRFEISLLMAGSL